MKRMQNKDGSQGWRADALQIALLFSCKMPGTLCNAMVLHRQAV